MDNLKIKITINQHIKFNNLLSINQEGFIHIYSLVEDIAFNFQIIIYLIALNFHTGTPQ